MNEPIESLAGALTALLEVPMLTEQLRRNVELAQTFHHTACYFRQDALQALHRQKDPLLVRLEEKKRLRRLLDAAWHALDFLPPPTRSPVHGGIRDPKKDLREALEAVHNYLDAMSDEWA
jgi:hypothetical protein